jgi:hypothetical protein
MKLSTCVKQQFIIYKNELTIVRENILLYAKNKLAFFAEKKQLSSCLELNIAGKKTQLTTFMRKQFDVYIVPPP